MKIVIIAFIIILLLALLIIVEVLYAFNDIPKGFINPVQEVREYGSDGNELIYFVFGDSTAAGQGAVYEQGIAVSTAKHLAKSHKVKMINYGVSGATLVDVLEKQIPKMSHINPGIVLLSVGGNDVTHRTSNSDIDQRLEGIINAIKSKNDQVKIVLTGSPDMGSVPRFLPPLSWIATLQSNRINVVFHSKIEKYNLTFAPIAQKTGPVFKKDRSLFASDKFHPNEKGYAVWNTVLNNALDEALKI